MPFHLAPYLRAIGEAHSEALDRQVARVRDIAFKYFGIHLMLRLWDPMFAPRWQ
jgi:hypothetical protein